jgi:protein SCO1/2
VKKSAGRWPCLLFAMALGLAGCGPSSPRVSGNSADVRSYAGQGIIENISPDRHLVTIHHQAIPGYMMEMTMDFPVRDDRLLDGLSAGDRIEFTLRVAQDDAWIESVRRTGRADAAAVQNGALLAAAPELHRGDALPNAELTAEDGRQLHLADFRGKAVVLTFFFTRCPLPTYCPLMNRNFARTRELLLAQPGAPKDWQFLSISFDPDFDTPPVLASYATAYRGSNHDRWLFASVSPATLPTLAGPLGLVVMRQGGSISHNVRTIVIDPAGRLYRQFNDNTWTPEELAAAVVRAARNVAQGPIAAP